MNWFLVYFFEISKLSVEESWLIWVLDFIKFTPEAGKFQILESTSRYFESTLNLASVGMLSQEEQEYRTASVESAISTEKS